jgi:hypothetical protein
VTVVPDTGDMWTRRPFGSVQLHVEWRTPAKVEGEGQVYDIAFLAPKFGRGGGVERPAMMTVLHNGVLVQNQVTLEGPTLYIGEPSYEKHAARLPLMLQEHDNPVSFRNIWIRELED